MDRSHLQRIVHEILVEEFELAPEAVHAGARLGEDLELDSLDRVDLIVTLEKAVGARFVENQLEQVRTVADLIDAVARVTAAGT